MLNFWYYNYMKINKYSYASLVKRSFIQLEDLRDILDYANGGMNDNYPTLVLIEAILDIREFKQKPKNKK